MPSFPRIALQSLPLTLFLMVCSVGLVALSAIPSVGVQLGPLVCEAGETMVYETTRWSSPGRSGESVAYFCESETGRTPADTSQIIFWAAIAYVVLWMLIVWPIVTLFRYRSARNERRLGREGIPATATIESVQQTNLVVNRMPVLKITLKVEPHGRPPFETTMRRTTPEIFIPYLQPGRTVPVLLDPSKPGKVILRFDEIAQHAIASDADKGDRDTDLQTLRSLKTMLDEGLIEQSEYDAKKTEIMERM